MGRQWDTDKPRNFKVADQQVLSERGFGRVAVTLQYLDGTTRVVEYPHRAPELISTEEGDADTDSSNE